VKYLLDTALIIELVKKEPDTAVVRWLDEQDEQNLFLSILTLGELQKGISKLPVGSRKAELQTWVTVDLVERFTGRIIDLDLETALFWGKMQGESELKGDKLPVMDSLIAAVATVHGLVVVSHSDMGLSRCRVRIFDPWIQ
jgi:predicted nucleic acid-binding protein